MFILLFPFQSQAVADHADTAHCHGGPGNQDWTASPTNVLFTTKTLLNMQNCG
jgi:hypothetical protein